MSFIINIQELRERAATRVATVATLLPDGGGSKLATVAGVAANLGAQVSAVHDDARACAGCRHRLRPGTCGEPVAAGLAPKFEIRWPPAGHAHACPAYSANAPVEPPRRPYRLTKGDADSCHRTEWDDAEISAFTTRVLKFVARGIGPTDADDLAERLTLRDREQDDRRMCLECVYLKANGRCAAAHAGRLPGVDLRFEPVQTQLWRCEGFAELAAP